MNRIARRRRSLLVLAIAALAAMALAAGGVAAAPGQGKAKGHAKGFKISRGATTLTGDVAHATKLVTEGVSVEVLKPAKDDADNVFDPAFPITNGRLVLTPANNPITNVTGKIWHTGGLSLTEGTNTLTTRNARIVLGETEDFVTAQVSVNGGEVERVRWFELDGGDASRSTEGKRRIFELEDVEVSLNATSAGQLNTLFATAPAVPFTAGEVIGELDVKTRLIGRRN